MGLDLNGQKLRELAEQYDRLLAAKVTVSLLGKPGVKGNGIDHDTLRAPSGAAV